jgi:hypothetical protein
VSAVKEEEIGWRFIVSSCNWLWLRVTAKEAVSKSNANPVIISHWVINLSQNHINICYRHIPRHRNIWYISGDRLLNYTGSWWIGRTVGYKWRHSNVSNRMWRWDLSSRYRKLESSLLISQILKIHYFMLFYWLIRWSPVTTAWRVLRLRMEKMASRHEV